MNLTKSNLLNGTDCQKRLHYTLFKSNLAIWEKDPALEFLAKQGYDFEKIVCGLYPMALHQPEYVYDGIYVRPDIVDGNELIEVKSSTKVKEEQILDAAIQYYVITGKEIELKKCYIAVVNREYVLKGKLNPKKMVKIVDVTAEGLALMPEVEKLISSCRATAKLKRAPSKTVGQHCFDCPFIETCSKELLKASVFDLRRGGKKSWELYDLGVKEIKDIPESYKLTSFQEIQRDAAINGTYVDKTKIKSSIGKLKYNLNFLDFEAFIAAIPRYDGCSPYDQVTFQASLHVQRTPGGELEHFEYLHNEDSDPRENIAKFLVENIDEKGSVIAYHASYEKGRILEMAKKYPKYRKRLESIADRLWDLEDIFNKGYYVSSEFKGSTSIKKILPVFVPELDYSTLSISNGALAYIGYLEMINYKTSSRKKKEIYSSLLEYCKMDTYAMYAILESLRRCL
jgi:hypothetical protein